MKAGGRVGRNWPQAGSLRRGYLRNMMVITSVAIAVPLYGLAGRGTVRIPDGIRRPAPAIRS